MKTRKFSAKIDRAVLIGMIVDANALRQIVPIWRKINFPSKMGNIIGNWCVDYCDKYNKAPMKHIEGLFQAWADNETKRDPATVKSIDSLLGSLSDEYTNLKKLSNTQYVVDQATALFNKTRAAKHAEKIMGHIEAGEADKAVLLAESGFEKAEAGKYQIIDVLRNKEAMRIAFESKGDPLITASGDLGKFLGDSLERDAFIALMGPEKSQKTWWLIELAWMAMRQRRKVMFFEIGDLSQNQIMRRFMTRAAKRPFMKRKFMYPTGMTSVDDEIQVDLEEREETKGLTWKEGFEACEKVIRKDIRSKESYLNLSCHPNSSISVKGMETILKRLEKKDGWVPDVVVIDYADILDHGSGKEDGRERINSSWKRMRSLSQETHSLVLTATQAKATAYNAKTMDMSHFSEDKRKFAHVTGMIALNRTPEERQQQLTRLGWVVLRESDFEIGRCVSVAGCLSIGCPALRSIYLGSNKL